MCVDILKLPDVALDMILSFLSYEEIAKCRRVCQQFNQLGGQLLTRGFLQVKKRHVALHKKVRGQLPRRESERRTHPLAKHCDCLAAVETRISMLSMTYGKYIERKLCCFIPGKVLDELFTILNKVESTQTPPRTSELLQELRDISSMAMEHFEEHVLPCLQPKIEKCNSSSSNLSVKVSASTTALIKQMFSGERTRHRKQVKQLNNQMLELFKTVKRMDYKCKNQTKLLVKSTLKVLHQERILDKHETKIKEQETVITELKRNVDEWDQKLLDLTSELIRAREELLGSSKPPGTTTPLIYSGSNIKPRTSILRYYDPPTVPDVDRKRKSPFVQTESPSKIAKILDNTKIANIINKALTNNISSMTRVESTAEPQEIAIDRSSEFSKGGFSSVVSSSLEKLIKGPITSIKSRKRKMNEDINFT